MPLFRFAEFDNTRQELRRTGVTLEFCADNLLDAMNAALYTARIHNGAARLGSIGLTVFLSGHSNHLLWSADNLCDHFRTINEAEATLRNLRKMSEKI